MQSSFTISQHAMHYINLLEMKALKWVVGDPPHVVPVTTATLFVATATFGSTSRASHSGHQLVVLFFILDGPVKPVSHLHAYMASIEAQGGLLESQAVFNYASFLASSDPTL